VNNSNDLFLWVYEYIKSLYCINYNKKSRWLLRLDLCGFHLSILDVQHHICFLFAVHLKMSSVNEILLFQSNQKPPDYSSSNKNTCHFTVFKNLQDIIQNNHILLQTANFVICLVKKIWGGQSVNKCDATQIRFRK